MKMKDYIILDEYSLEDLEEGVLTTLGRQHFDLLGGVVVYKDERNRIHFLQTLYKGPK